MRLPPADNCRRRWRLALGGQFICVFAVVALSGPGRIDIVDGQARYETARSMVDHGDLVVRAPDLWFSIQPGRGGQRYSVYRFPQTAAGICAICLADVTGPALETRRHFFFSLIGAVACAALAVTYSIWFLATGLTVRQAIGWSTAGIFCTQNWYYGTSTFDDILGSLSIVMAITIAYATRHRHPMAGATISGLLLGWAFNCKQPLGAYVLAVSAAQLDPARSLKNQWKRVAVILAGLAVGIGFYEAYHFYKFPIGMDTQDLEIGGRYAPNFPGNPAVAILCLGVSPGAGVLWYSPAFVIGAAGAAHWYLRDRRWTRALSASSGVFVLFISTLTIFKGDPAWGPRYLTPVLAAFWLFTPVGVARMRRRTVALLLVAGFVVQVAALSVDPHRLYVERGLPSAFGVVRPWMYFDLNASHLVQRPREIWEIAVGNEDSAEMFSPSSVPTFAFPIIDDLEGGPSAVRKYHVLNSLRPWWASQQYLQPGERPVNLGKTVALFIGVLLSGLALLVSQCSRYSELVDPKCRAGNDTELG